MTRSQSLKLFRIQNSDLKKMGRGLVSAKVNTYESTQNFIFSSISHMCSAIEVCIEKHLVNSNASIRKACVTSLRTILGRIISLREKAWVYLSS